MWLYNRGKRIKKESNGGGGGGGGKKKIKKKKKKIKKKKKNKREWDRDEKFESSEIIFLWEVC